jgi:hypothetical protein
MKEKMEIVSALIRKAESDLITAQHSLNIRRNTLTIQYAFTHNNAQKNILKRFSHFMK